MRNCYYGGIYSSIIGDIGIMAYENTIIYVELLEQNTHTFHTHKIYQNLRQNNISKKATQYLIQYFAGIKQECDIALAPQGTPFQKHVWTMLQQVPFGTTKSYKEIAIMLGKPNAMRAVGNACAKNPILFFIPCHRIVGNNGNLGGYRAGIALKQHLLLHEQDCISTHLP